MATSSLPVQPIQRASRVGKRTITRVRWPLSWTCTFLVISWSDVKIRLSVISIRIGILCIDSFIWLHGIRQVRLQPTTELPELCGEVTSHGWIHAKASNETSKRLKQPSTPAWIFSRAPTEQSQETYSFLVSYRFGLVEFYAQLRWLNTNVIVLLLLLIWRDVNHYLTSVQYFRQSMISFCNWSQLRELIYRTLPRSPYRLEYKTVPCSTYQYRLIPNSLRRIWHTAR